MRRIRQYVLIAVAILGALFAIKALNSDFRSYSICGDCGEFQHTTEWRIPFVDKTYWTTQSTSDSPLSIVVKRYGLVPSHSHHWLFVEGYGTDRSYAIGNGANLLGSVNAKYVADFLDCACKCDEKYFAQAWLKLTLDPATSNEARHAIPEIPKGGLSDRIAFEKWWHDNAEFSSQILGQPVPHLDRDIYLAIQPAK